MPQCFAAAELISTLRRSARRAHEDGTLGLWALPDRGRGEPRLVIRYDHPLLESNFISVGPDRAYLTVERNESDVWVATVKR